MADKKISQLTAFTTLASGDLLPVAQVSTNITKKITYANLLSNVSGGILVSGTLGYHAKFGVGGTTAVNSMVYDNGVSVSVGTASPNASALLQLDSTSKGFLPPRGTTAQKNAISSPATGLIFYDSTLNVPYFYNGSAWTAFSTFSGSGTADYLARWTSSSALSTGATRDDGTWVSIGGAIDATIKFQVYNSVSPISIQAKNTFNAAGVPTYIMYGENLNTNSSSNYGVWYIASGASTMNSAAVFIAQGSTGSKTTLDVRAGGGGANIGVLIDVTGGTTNYALITSSGFVGLRQAAPTAYLHLGAGTATAGTAPLKFTSGTSMTSAEPGAMEFTTDDLFFTITTGNARKRILVADAVGGLTSGRVAYVTTNGRLLDNAAFTFSGTRLSPNWINLAAGTATANQSPLKFVAGTNLTSAEAGAMEWDGTNLFITQTTGPTRKTIAYTTDIPTQAYSTLFNYYADSGNVGAGETDLFTDSIAANTLSANAYKLSAEYGGVYNLSLNNKQIKVYFAGTLIFDTGALAITTLNSWDICITIIRSDTDKARASVTMNSSSATLSSYATETDLTGLDFTTGNILKLTGTGVANDDIVAKLGYIALIK